MFVLDAFPWHFSMGQFVLGLFVCFDFELEHFQPAGSYRPRAFIDVERGRGRRAAGMVGNGQLEGRGPEGQRGEKTVKREKERKRAKEREKERRESTRKKEINARRKRFVIEEGNGKKKKEREGRAKAKEKQ